MEGILITVVLYWGLGFLGLMLLSLKFGKAKLPHTASMILLVILGVLLFGEAFSAWSMLQYSILIIIFITNIFIGKALYRFGRNKGAEPNALIKSAHKMKFLRLSNNFLLPKSFEVLFQQIVIYALFISWIETVGDTNIVFYGAFLFGFLHIPMLFASKGHGQFRYVFFLISFLMGGVFALLLSISPHLLLLTYTIHFQLYVLGGIFFWLWGKRSAEKLGG